MTPVAQATRKARPDPSQGHVPTLLWEMAREGAKDRRARGVTRGLPRPRREAIFYVSLARLSRRVAWATDPQRGDCRANSWGAWADRRHGQDGASDGQEKREAGGGAGAQGARPAPVGREGASTRDRAAK